MSKPGVPQVQSVNTSMLASMQEHNNPRVGSGAAVGAGNGALGMQVGEEVSQGLKASVVDLGASGNADSLIQHLKGALEQSVVDAFAQNMEICGISHPGFNMKLSGDTGLENLQPFRPRGQFNAPGEVEGIISHGQGHSQ
jgi:hypothetical protein